MNKQYIGARYVPKFMGEWSETTKYEALCVVDDGYGTTYISRVPVPVGTPLTDRDYWIVYGASSGAILDLQTRMGEAEEDIDDLETAMGTAETDISGLKTRMTGAEGDIDTLESAVSTLTSDMTTAKSNITTLQGKMNTAETKLSRLEHRRVILIGDSYGVQNDGSVSTFFYEYFRQALGLTEGTSFFKSFASGAGFGNNGYLTALQSLSESISDKNTITDILVCGGWNDSDKSQTYGSDAAFTNGVTAFMQYAYEHYPWCKLSVAHISWGNPQTYAAVRTQMPVSINRYEGLGSRGFRVLSGTQWILHRYGAGIWQSDGAHPAQQGQGYLGQRLPVAFLNGAIDVDYVHESGKTCVASWSSVQIVGSVANDDIYEEFHNGVYTVSIKNVNLSMQPASGQSYINMPANGNNTMAAFGTDLEFGLGGNKAGIMYVPVRVYTGSVWRTGMAGVWLDNNLFRLCPCIVFNDGSVTDTVQCTHIIIPTITLTIPYTQC